MASVTARLTTYTPPPALSQAIDNILSFDVEKDLVNEADLGKTYSFSAGRATFAEIRAFCDELRRISWDGVPETKIYAVVAAAGSVINALQTIKDFRPQNYGASADSGRADLLNRIEIQYNTLFEVAVPVLALKLSQRREDVEEQQHAREQVRVLVEQTQTSFLLQQKFTEEARAAAESLRQTARQGGITKYATLFLREAESHQRTSWAWLFGTAVLAGIAALLGYLNYTHILNMADKSVAHAQNPGTLINSAVLPTSIAIQLAVARLILFTLILSAIFWCGRIYRAHRHNFVVNRHRQNALSTFEAFVTASEGDIQTKNAVLLQATQCIFSPQQSGYMGKESDGSDVQPKILELVRSIKE